MNAVKACVFAAFAIMVLGGCTTTRTLSVSQENRIAPSYEQGKPRLQSVKRNTVAVWLLTPTYKADLNDLIPPAFLLMVRNGGDQTISLSRDDITATVEGRPIHVLTYEAYRDEITRRSDWEVARIQSALRGMNEPMTPSQRGMDSTGQMVGGTDSMGDVGTMSSPEADASFRAQGWIKISKIDHRRDTLLADARSMLMLDQYSIAPGEAVAGVVRLKPADLSSGQRLRILVKTGDETHEFLYDVRS